MQSKCWSPIHEASVVVAILGIDRPSAPLLLLVANHPFVVGPCESLRRWEMAPAATRPTRGRRTRRIKGRPYTWDPTERENTGGRTRVSMRAATERMKHRACSSCTDAIGALQESNRQQRCLSIVAAAPSSHHPPEPCHSTHPRDPRRGVANAASFSLTSFHPSPTPSGWCPWF